MFRTIRMKPPSTSSRIFVRRALVPSPIVSFPLVSTIVTSPIWWVVSFTLIELFSFSAEVLTSVQAAGGSILAGVDALKSVHKGPRQGPLRGQTELDEETAD